MSAASAAGSPVTPSASVPRHVAIVMDGNGRWARKRFMPRVFGHKFGMKTVVRVIDDCASRGIEYLTVYAFSSENWKRPDEEVSGLMNLVLVGASKYLADGNPPELLSEAVLSRYMALAHAPDPDLFIRTGGEVRVSNFLLWQLAYAEFHFTDCLWPDFDAAELDQAIAAFASRDRRFGGVKEGASPIATNGASA